MSERKWDEVSFKNAYRDAYEKIVPDRDCIRRLLDREKEGRHGYGIFKTACTVAAAAMVFCLMVVLLLPFAVKAAPGVYAWVVKYVPSLADYCLPEEYSCSSQGIVMQVEAVNVEGNTAEVLISFSDEEGGDLITGEVDLYNSYHLRSYEAVSNVGGCSFVGYDEAADKAYFKINISAFDKSGQRDFDKAKLVFSVGQLLTVHSEEKRWIALDHPVMDPATKGATLCGGGGTARDRYEEQYLGRAGDGDPRPMARVMDIKREDRDMSNMLEVVGIGYQDGMLRVQICRGNFADSDRHMMLWLVDETGNERHKDYGVSWQEEIEGEQVLFDEDWFIVEESELENLRLYGIYCRTEGCVKGDWEVTLKLCEE